MSASLLCSLGGWPSPTLGSAGRGCGSDIATGLHVASCSFPAPSRELDAPVPSMTSRSGRCSGSSTLMSLARSSCLARLILSLSRATLEAPSGSFSSSCSILSRHRSVWFAGYPIPVRMARQPEHWAARPNLSNISQVRRTLLGMVGGSISGGCTPLSPLASGRPTRMLTSPARPPSEDHGVPLMLSTNSVSHLS